MKSKPDPKRLKRATAEVVRDYEPRRLQGFGERRLSIADEKIEVERARRRNGEATRGELATALQHMSNELEFVKSQLGRVSPGDHRGYFREIDHGIQGLTRALSR